MFVSGIYTVFKKPSAARQAESESPLYLVNLQEMICRVDYVFNSGVKHVKTYNSRVVKILMLT